jgi:hypothetical protein
LINSIVVHDNRREYPRYSLILKENVRPEPFPGKLRRDVHALHPHASVGELTNLKERALMRSLSRSETELALQNSRFRKMPAD